MAVTGLTRRVVASALKSHTYADQLCDAIDSAAALNVGVEYAVQVAFGSPWSEAAGGFIDAVENDTALTAYELDGLAKALGDRVAALDINEELG